VSDLIKALADVRTHLRTVLISTCPDEHKVPLREALAVVDNAIGNCDGWCEQDTYAGFCDGERWVETVEAFEAAATRHRQRGPHLESAAELADGMAATTHDVMPDQMMAATEFLMAEFEERDGTLGHRHTAKRSTRCASVSPLVITQGTRPHFSRTWLLACRAAFNAGLCTRIPT
jgi:hypothetical protein